MARDQPQKSSKLVGNQPTGQSQHHHVNHHNKIVHFEPFCLLSPNDKSLRRAAEFVESASLNRYKVCVVSIISKDALNKSTEDQLIESLLSNNIANGLYKSKRQHPKHKLTHKGQTSKTSEEEDTVVNGEWNQTNILSNEIQIVGHVNCNTGIIVLNLTSFLEADQLFETVNMNSVQTGPLLSDLWPKWNQNLIKAMLMLFIMSHIVVFYNPEPSIDYSLIQTFKILENLRLKSQTRITDLLETISSKQMFPQQWIRQGRVSCPRALFVCDITQMKVTVNQSEVAGLKRDLEDQIYKLLKKTNIINRPLSPNNHNQQQALFSLPDMEDFVFIITRPNSNIPPDIQQETEKHITKQNLSAPKDFYANLIKTLAIGSDTIDENSEEPKQNKLAQRDQVFLNHETGLLGENQSNNVTSYTAENQTKFRKFLNRHISCIQAQFDQDIKSHSGKQSGMVLPRYDDFFNVLLRLKSLIFQTSVADRLDGSESTDWLAPDERRFIDIYDSLNIDELFSEVHCQRTRLAAFNFFSRSIQVPPSRTNHRNSMQSAKKLYLIHARGSACQSNLSLLLEQCNQHWQSLSSSRQTTGGHNGRNAKRNGRLTNRSSGSPTEVEFSTDSQSANNIADENTKPDLSIVVRRRANGVKLLTSCHCGRQSTFMITPVDHKKKLERVDIHRLKE